MSLEENKAVVIRHLKEVLEGGRVELIESYYAPQAPNVVFGTPEQWRDLVLWHHKVAPGLKINILDMMAEGDKVMARWQAEITFTSKYASEYDDPFPPLDVPARWMLMSILQIEDGKIVSEQIINTWESLLFNVVLTSLKKAATNKAVARRFHEEAWNQGNVEALAEYYAPDGSVSDLNPIEVVKQNIAFFRKHAPGFKFTILDQIAEGDQVVQHWKVDLTYSVPADPPPDEPFLPLGRPVSWKGVDIYRIADGKIVAAQYTNPWTDMLVESGAIPLEKIKQNKAAVRKFFDAVNRRDNDLLAEVCAPEEAKNWIDMLPVAYAMWKDHHVELVDMVADGEMVAVKMATSGYHNGEAYGLAPTGKWWTNNGNGLFYFSDGKISKTDFVFDVENHIKQLGGVIRPAAA